MRSLKNCFLLLLSLIFVNYATAQILDLKKVLKKKASNKVNTEINKEIDKGIDSVSNAIKPTDKNNAATTESTELKNPVTKKTASVDSIPPEKKEQPALETYSKYDFVPGEKVIFYDDFSQGNIGDFPALWNTNGSAEIVTTNIYPGRWMKFITRDAIWTDQLLSLPENYTIEFDVIPIKGENQQMTGYEVRLLQTVNVKSFDYGSAPGKAGFKFDCAYFGRPNYSTHINGPEGQGLSLSGSREEKQFYQLLDQKYHIAFWVQKSRVRVYLNENKMFDLPKAFPVPSIKIDRLRFEAGAAMVSNIRVAVGNPDMRSKLITEGKLVSYGIYFDVNADKVKPASYATLKTIADILTENAGVKIKIIGHTDADGNDAANLDLSKRRAAAVKAELVKTFSIDPAIIDTDGKGESQPVAANDTPSNKALNRRVEFIKQ